MRHVITCIALAAYTGCALGDTDSLDGSSSESISEVAAKSMPNAPR